MPEGDTVWLQAQRLNSALGGEQLMGCDLRVPRFATTDLSGCQVTAARSRGKHLLIECTGGVLGDSTALIHSHLKMGGIWQFYPRQGAGSRWRRPAHTARAVLTTADTVAVGFSLGILEVLSPAEAAERLSRLGPDLLGPDWDAAEAVRRLAAQPGRPLGQALLDQRNLAGIGNIYRNELCFLAGLRSSSPVVEADLLRLVKQARRLLEANKRRTQRITTGLPGLVADERSWVYGRANRPCHRCGTLIHQTEEAGRPLYSCPRCQPKPKLVG
ncbi:Fpg/Nei family DNA glycosylase [Acaricomes phytoseiuli]|uniref:DNA-formamidopyrimidine glycosylase family protein n=1 Tax=Acaricomes phytoseiuli TaxID=291968 RepID=UPI00222193B5|nr:DNA-formamidopyrimidine glycosylase family protein [Acaricomes phytoseiuli]MCW1249714.1 Fpg/Nei family DNA glycosylase [Acaricomes phytoseiuli]